VRFILGRDLEGGRIEVWEGDITDADVDAIVNPANSLGIMGGGVAYAIKKKGGAEIEKEAMRKAPIPVGSAIATTAGKLKARYVVHAPTMERPAGRTSLDKVKRAVRAALNVAEDVGAESIAFPGMGTGVGGLKAEEAAAVIVSTVVEFLRGSRNVRRVLLVGFTPDLVEAFSKALEET